MKGYQCYQKLGSTVTNVTKILAKITIVTNFFGSKLGTNNVTKYLAQKLLMLPNFLAQGNQIIG